ncbi:MAG TPA: hypothetical protein VHA05_00730 [Candidatus Saccharimonadales bacterium]|nr:hypothetical protein [Candidatus Saccharimonadales bacterium]
MQTASVQRLARNALDIFVELVPPFVNHFYNVRFGSFKCHHEADHNNNPGPKPDLYVGPRDQPEDEKIVHFTPPFWDCLGLFGAEVEISFGLDYTLNCKDVK